MRRVLIPTMGFLALLGLSCPALAAGFMVRENSAEAVAMSYAGDGSRASGPDTAQSCGPMVRSGSAALKAGMRPSVGRKP